MMPTLSRRGSLLVALAVLSAAPAQAQDAQVPAAVPVDPPAPREAPKPSPSAPDEANAGGLAEIVVTAQKREERLQDVPIAIAAFSGEQLEAAGVKTMADLASKTPGLVFDTLVNYSLIYIRGVGTDAFIPSADLSVAPYIDGVYFPISFGLARSLGEIERVEVLKGPQGTLFGRNATGGAINIVTKDPDDTFTARLSSSYGRYDENNNRLFVSGPIANGLSGSVAVLYNYRHDYYDAVAPSPIEQWQPYQDKGANGKLRWAATDWFDATLAGYWFKSRGIGTSMLNCITPSDAGVLLGIDCATGYNSNVNANDAAWNELAAGALTLNLRPGPLDIKSITAYQDTDGQSLVDFDGSSANLVSFGGESRDKTGERLLFGKIFTQELQFISNDESFASDSLKWIAGLYLLDSTVGYDPVNFYVAQLQGGLGGILDGSAPLPFQVPGATAFGSFLQDLLGPLADVASFNAKVYGSLDTRSYAGFLQGTWTPVEWFDVTLGGRVQKEKRKVYDAKLDAQATVLGQDVHPQLLEYADDHLSKTDFSPKVTLDVKPFEDVLVYASYQKAFKSGSFNIINLTAPPTEIRSETVTTYEAGFKSQFFGRHLQLNGAVFHNTIDDLQSQFVSLLSGGVVQFQNADKAKVKGLDLDAVWLPVAGLTLNAGVTLLDSRYASFEDAAGYTPSGVFSPSNDFSGNEIVRNPEGTAVAGVAWSHALFDGVVDAGADYYYNDGFWFDAQNSLRQHAYDLVNARLGYTWSPWNLTLTAFGANVFGTKYYIYQFQTDFSTVGKLAPPATWGLRLNWTF